MFCQPDFITNKKIFAFLNASIDWSKKNHCYRNNFNLMGLQYSLIGSLWHNANLCQNVVIFSFHENCVDNFDLSQFLNKRMVL